MHISRPRNRHTDTSTPGPNTYLWPDVWAVIRLVPLCCVLVNCIGVLQGVAIVAALVCVQAAAAQGFLAMGPTHVVAAGGVLVRCFDVGWQVLFWQECVEKKVVCQVEEQQEVPATK
jgi:hypothetical protein